MEKTTINSFITRKICKYVEFQSSIQLSYCRTNELRVYFSGIIKLISRIIFYKQTMSQSVPKYSWGSNHIKRATTGLVSTLPAVNSIEAAKSKLLQRVHPTKKKANGPPNFLTTRNLSHWLLNTIHLKRQLYFFSAK
jgi:hypothetical protein